MISLHTRPALVAALSCSLAGSSLARAQATPDPSHHLGVCALLARLDALFGEGDVNGYLAMFRPDNPGAHAARQKRLHSLLDGKPRTQRVSAVTSDPRQIGDRTVVRVRHELRCAAVPSQSTNDVVFHEDTMIAVQQLADGGFVVTFEVPIPTSVACVRGDLFRCPPCNYEIGGAAGWLCVPMERESGQSLEAVGFWLIGTDIVCEISVQVDMNAPPAREIADQLARTLAGGAPPTAIGEITNWRPPTHANEPPRNCTGARVEVTLPDAASLGGTSRSVFHVLTLGALQHILLARGSETSMHQHAEAMRQLLATYRLRDLDPKHALAAVSPFLHHTGGKLDGVAYHNERYGLDCVGPAGWHAQQLCGGAAFHVRWTNERGGTMELIGYRTPAGITAWSPASATAWVRHLMAGANLTPGAGTTPFAWTKDTSCGGVSCCVACTPIANTNSTAVKRALHLVVRDDLVLVVDARAIDPSDEGALHEAIRSLRIR